jgi:hypothetical protein
MPAIRAMLVLLICALTVCVGDGTLFEDDFRGKLGPGWSWLREHRDAWRASEGGLEVRIEPGNMWGPANDAKNVLLRAAPEAGDEGLEVSAQVENRPTNQYEQVDLVWYYDDGHMVKLGEELVDGKLSVVMGREEKDRTRTIAIIPLDSFIVRLRLSVQKGRIQGHFQPGGSGQWHAAGECDLPARGDGKPQISLQFYQGVADVEHWARVTEFRILKLGR